MEAIVTQVNTSPETVDWKALSSMKLENSDYYKFLRLVKRNIDKSWDWSQVVYKILPWDLVQFISFDTVLANPDVDWDWYLLTEKFLWCFPYEKFVETRHLKWDWKVISERIKNIHDLKKLNIFTDCPLDWKIISENMNEIIKHRVIPLDDLPAGYFVSDHFDEFLEYAELFPWRFTILTSGLPKVKIDKLALKIYGYTK
jgi:hypothetical protein